MKFTANVLPATFALASFMTREADAIYLPGIVRLFRGEGDLTDSVTSNDNTDLTASPNPDNSPTFPNETPYNGISRKVFYFDGTGHALGSTIGLPSGSESRTIVGWVKKEVEDHAYDLAHVFGYGGPSWPCSTIYDLFFAENTFNLESMMCDDQDDTGSFATNFDVWFHFAASWDGTKHRIYVDGNKMIEAETDVHPNTSTDGEMGAYVFLGGHPSFVGQGWDNRYAKAFAADYGIFNRVLSDEEVKSVFDSKHGLQGPLTIEEKYSLSLVVNSTIAAFNKDSKDEEVKFKLKVADVSLGELDDAITILDYSTCGFTFDDTTMISATYDKESKVANRSDERYWDLPILVDVDTAKFNTATPYEYFTELGNNKVQLKFCVKSELGSSTVVNLNDSTEETSSIAYTKVKFDVTINMETGFTTDLKIEEDSASTASKDVVIDYDLTAYECNDDDTKITDPPAKNQNSMVRICIDTPAENDVVIASIKDFKLKSDLIASNAIKDNVRNALTEVEGEGSKTVAVTTQMVSAFFSDLDPAVTDNTIDIEGTAVMEFKATGERKLVRISNSNQKNGNVSDMDRKLDGDAGLGEFAMKVGISKSSSEANGAATSGASNALSATPLVTVTSLALGGVLMGTMF